MISTKCGKVLSVDMHKLRGSCNHMQCSSAGVLKSKADVALHCFVSRCMLYRWPLSTEAFVMCS